MGTSWAYSSSVVEFTKESAVIEGGQDVAKVVRTRWMLHLESCSKKHCQRHNGPRVLSAKLRKSFFSQNHFKLVFSDCIALGPQMALLALVVNLATRWHCLHQLQIWPLGGASCISCKLGHQMAPLALVPKLATRLHRLHCHIALDCPFGTIS